MLEEASLLLGIVFFLDYLLLDCFLTIYFEMTAQKQGENPSMVHELSFFVRVVFVFVYRAEMFRAGGKNSIYFGLAILRKRIRLMLA